MNTTYSVAGKFVMISALILTVFVAYVITKAAADVKFIQDGGDYRLVQATQTA
jgi:hypothetical protein